MGKCPCGALLCERCTARGACATCVHEDKVKIPEPERKPAKVERATDFDDETTPIIPDPFHWKSYLHDTSAQLEVWSALLGVGYEQRRDESRAAFLNRIQDTLVKKLTDPPRRV